MLCCVGLAVPHQQRPGPGGEGCGQDGCGMRDAGAGIAGTQAPSLLLWQWELKMQKAAHPLEGAGTGSTRQHPTHLQVHSPIPAMRALGGRHAACSTQGMHLSAPWGD